MDKFIEWLKLHTPLTEKTRKEYASAFKRIADNLAQSNSIELFSEDVKDLKDLQKIKENYFSIEENKNTDKNNSWAIFLSPLKKKHQLYLMVILMKIFMPKILNLL